LPSGWQDAPAALPLPERARTRTTRGSLAAASRSRGVAACNGQREDPHAAAGCDVGALHTRAGDLAIALAAMLEERGGVRRAVAALEQLDAELARVIRDRPRVA
jgi:hypothetical protein